MAVSSVQARTEAFFAERKSESNDRLRKVLIGLIVVSLYPILDQWLGIGLLGSLIPILMYALLAMGLNIVVGYAGLLDIGYVAFFIIGAYAQAFLTSPNSFFIRNGVVPGFVQNFWVAMLFSWVLAAIFGVLIGAPTLRLRGDYLAIVTLGFGEIVPDFFTNAAGITGGPRGIGQIAKPPAIPLPGDRSISFSSTDHVSWFYLLLAVGLLTLFVITRLYDSRQSVKTRSLPPAWASLLFRPSFGRLHSARRSPDSLVPCTRAMSNRYTRISSSSRSPFSYSPWSSWVVSGTSMVFWLARSSSARSIASCQSS